MEKLMKNKGITLIALVITIIVLLILAGISISMLSGDNSILQKAGVAKEKTEDAGTKEQVQLQVLGSYEGTTNLNLQTLKTNLESIGAKVIADDFPVTAILNHKSYKIDANGKVEMQENADRTGINVGDYINFEPDTDYDEDGKPISKIYPKEYLADEFTGVFQEYHNSEDLVRSPIKWQVLKIYEDGSIKLRGRENNNVFWLKDATAYNNAIWILNDICEQFYSKKSSGITARNINLEDFEDDDYYISEAKGNWIKARDNYINDEILARKGELSSDSDYIDNVDTVNKTVTYKKYFYYPNLYAKEKYSGIDTSNLKSNGLTRSEKAISSREFLDTSTENNARKQAKNNITVKQTGYEIDINYENYGVAYNVLGGGIHNYFIASRVTSCESYVANFGIPYFGINKNKMHVLDLCKSSKTGKTICGGSVCPIVTLGPNVKITPSETASSEDGTPHEITAYK